MLYALVSLAVPAAGLVPEAFLRESMTNPADEEAPLLSLETVDTLLKIRAEGDRPETELERMRSSKLERMRFFIWNKHMKFDATSDQEVEIHAGRWHTKFKSYGGEIIDPLKGQKSKIYDSTLKTEIGIAGFNSRVPAGGLEQIIEAHYLKGDADEYNFIGLDWRYLAAWQGGIDGYNVPANNVLPAGIRGAQMLHAMMTDGTVTNYDQIHIIGHSLGAHVAGNMGRELESLVGTKISHITALSPAGPKFVDDKDSDIALKITDATYIDAVHTDGGVHRPFVIQGHLGDARPGMADANFYFNGGQTQPGCKPSFGLCSHQRAWKYYGVSVSNPKGFLGKACRIAPGTTRRGKVDWRERHLKYDGCLKMKVSNASTTAYLTDYYGDDKPMGDFVVKTLGYAPYIDATWDDSAGELELEAMLPPYKVELD